VNITPRRSTSGIRAGAEADAAVTSWYVGLLESGGAATGSQIVSASTGGALYGEGRFLPARGSSVNPEAPLRGPASITVEHYLYIWKLLTDSNYTVLRYPNVFGPRQNSPTAKRDERDLHRAHARGQAPAIFGTGEQVRGLSLRR